MCTYIWVSGELTLVRNKDIIKEREKIIAQKKKDKSFIGKRAVADIVAQKSN